MDPTSQERAAGRSGAGAQKWRITPPWNGGDFVISCHGILSLKYNIYIRVYLM